MEREITYQNTYKAGFSYFAGKVRFVSVDNEIQDKYMDAVLAMLMDEYAEAEAEMLLQNSKDEIPEVEMPEELDRKCQALIRKKFVRKKRQHALEALGRASKWAAVLTIILLGTFSALFLTVDAVRTPVINLYLKNMGNHSVLTIGQPSQQSMHYCTKDIIQIPFRKRRK